MGIVIRQSFWSSIFLFLGVFLGALNVLVLFKLILGDEIFGLTRILLSFSFIAAEFAVLGTPTMLLKYFPFFKEEKNKGVILFGFCILLVGTLLTVFVLWFFKEPIILSKEGNPDLVRSYYFVTLVSLIGVALYKFFQAYFKAILVTVLPVFLNDFMLRLYITLWLLAYSFFQIDLYTWMLGYALIYLINPLIMILYLQIKGRLDFSWNRKFTPKLRKEAFSFGLWNLMAGASTSLVNNVDIFMLWQFLIQAEEKIAVYSRALYISALIIIPVRAIANIVQPLVSQMFKDKNYAGLARIYKQSSINQLIVSGFVFLVIWINIDAILMLLGDDATQAKWVVLFIGLSKVFSVATGINGLLINHSEHYRYTTYFILTLSILTIVFNIIFIPKYQLLGAAIATSFSVFMFNFLKWWFVFKKLKMQPFDWNSAKVVLAAGLAILVCHFIPNFFGTEIIHLLLDMTIKGIVAGGIFVFIILKAGLSKEITGIFQTFINKLGNG